MAQTFCKGNFSFTHHPVVTAKDHYGKEAGLREPWRGINTSGRLRLLVATKAIRVLFSKMGKLSILEY